MQYIFEREFDPGWTRSEAATEIGVIVARHVPLFLFSFESGARNAGPVTQLGQFLVLDSKDHPQVWSSKSPKKDFITNANFDESQANHRLATEVEHYLLKLLRAGAFDSGW
jgi:hypothetical protein